MKIYSHKFVLLLSVLLLSGVGRTACAQDDVMTRLKHFFTNIAAYHHQYTQEKVYLHLDNNAYFPGETLWFKAYVVGAGTLLPTDMSKVLYVELLTPEGELMERKTYPILNGRTNGEFHLDKIVHTGYYEVRAYTRAMLNWDPAYAFSRVIPIYDAPRDSLCYGKLSMYDEPLDGDIGIKRPATAVLKSPDTRREGHLLFTAYPEGGHLVHGLAGRVAFKVTDTKGHPVEASGRLCRADGTEIAPVNAVHEGMGLCQVPADWTGGYIELQSGEGKAERFDLPEAQEAGCTLQVLPGDSGGLAVQVRANAAFGQRVLGLSVTCRGVACYFDTLYVEAGVTNYRLLPRQDLRDGIHQITLFTPEGVVVAERLSWVTPRRRPMELSVAQSQESYKAFSPIALNFTLTDGEGQPQQGEFSLAVRDVDGELEADGADITTDLLLASDLKGYIHQPEYYLASCDSTHLAHLNLLLMVQGWRRYEWSEMSGVKPFRLKQPVEDGLLVDGKVVDFSSAHRGKPHIDVNLMIMLGQKFVSGSTVTDSLGNFALLAPSFYGDGIGYFTTTVKDKRQRCGVALNRGFSPAPAAYEPEQLLISPPATDISHVRQPQLFEWTDTLPKIVHLPEVRVKDKQHFFPYGSRYTWLGGESAGLRYATIYYNIEQELETELDKGDTDPSLWDWLKQRNKHVDVEFSMNATTGTHDNGRSELSDYSPAQQQAMRLSQGDINVVPGSGTPIVRYKGRPVIILVDNDLPKQETDFSMSEIRSLVIAEDPEAIRHFIPSFQDTSGDMPVTFLLYSRVDQNLLNYRKGQRITVLHGYSKYEEFYSPNYRTVDAPTPEDVRRTLYWAPSVITDKAGKASVLLFSNSRPTQRIHVTAEGMSVTGQTFSLSR